MPKKRPFFILCFHFFAIGLMADEEGWCYPEFPQKYLDTDVVYTPKIRLEYSKSQGNYPSFVPPKTLLIFFSSDQVDGVLKKYRCEKCDGCFKDVYFLSDYPGVAFAKFDVAAPVNAIKLDLAIEWGVKKFITVGGACTFQKYLNNGDIVVCDKAIRNEGVSHHYLSPGKYVSSSGKIKDVLLKTLDTNGEPYRIGTIMTTDAIFRLTAQEVKHYQKEGVLCTDMVLAAQYAVASTHDDVEMIGLYAIMSDSYANVKWERPPFPERQKAYDKIFEIALQTALKVNNND